MQAYSVSIVTDKDQCDPYAFYELLKEACNESVYSGMIVIDSEALKGTALLYTEGDIENTCLILLQHDTELVGFMCGEIGYMSRYFQREPIASETLWWVKPEHRGKIGNSSKEMLDLFESWGKYNGCSVATFSSQSNKHMDSVNKFYVKNGYTKLEESYMKELD